MGEFVAPMPSMESFHGEAKVHVVEAGLSTTEQGSNHAGVAAFGYYTRAGGGTVVVTGTTDWACGLLSDPAVSQVTANIINRLGDAGAKLQEPPAKKAKIE